MSSKKGIVYLFSDFDKDGAFKIGVTTGSAEKRKKSLQTGNSGELITVRTYETDFPFFIEKRLHDFYSGKKINNEWFELDDYDVDSFIKNCEMIERNINALKANEFFKIEKLK